MAKNDDGRMQSCGCVAERIGGKCYVSMSVGIFTSHGVQGRKPACYVGSVWGIASVGFKRGALAKGPFCGQITVFFVPLEAYFCQCHI